MADSIVNTLGAGSGIDITSLVSQLVDAQFANKTNAINRQNRALSNQISGVSSIKSSVTEFANGLKSLVTNGQLTTAPTSANTAIFKAAALAGAKLSGTSSTIEVRQLAQGQSVASAVVADRAAAIGTGKLTLTFGQGSVANGSFVAGSGTPIDIAITAGSSNLDQIAASINAANAGVTASIITDTGGARLTLKSKTGATQAFTLTATEDPGAPGLAALETTFGKPGVLFGTTAQDAVVAVDGITVTRSTNTINDLVDGVKIDLVSAAPGTSVALTSTTPTEQLRSSVNDLVAAFNDLQRLVASATNASTGALNGDTATRDLQQSLRRFTLTQLAPANAAGGPTTLAQIGVSTNRDGTLSVNATELSAALNKFPDAVEALFANGTGVSEGGVAAAFQAIADQATSKTTGLGASEDRYTKRQSTLSESLDKANIDKEAVRTRLTKQFSGSDARVAAYKSTGSLLTSFFAPKTNN